jgi:hypothetical protein
LKNSQLAESEMRAYRESKFSKHRLPARIAQILQALVLAMKVAITLI